MSNQPNQKLKLLYLLEILLKKTDADAGITMNEILGELVARGIDAERKSVCRDFDVLREYGWDVIFDTSSKRWLLAERPFSAEELVMLVDAVQSAPFLTEPMALGLVKKLKRFASESQEDRLDQRIDMAEYVKMSNPEVFWSIDAIQEAMHLGQKVQFRYFRFAADGSQVLSLDGRISEVTPLKLVYADGLYYLLAYSDRYGDMTPYRVDRMLDVGVSDEAATRNEAVATWQLQDDVRLSFGVFGSSPQEPVVFEIGEPLICTVMDKFGDDLDMYPLDDGRAKVYTRAPLCPQLFGWLFQLGTNVKLLGSKKAVEEYRTYLRDIAALYDESVTA